MATTIKMPQLGESVTEGTIERWLVKEGDTVAQYDPLFEVVTDKVNAEVPAEVAGTITKIMVADGETVKVGTPLAEIETNGAGQEQARTDAAAAKTEPSSAAPAAAGADGQPPATRAEAETQAQAETPPQPEASPGQVAEQQQPQARPSAGGGAQAAPSAPPPSATATEAATGAGGGARPSEPTNGSVRMTPAVRRLVREHGIDLSALSGSGAGGRVTRDDVLAFIKGGQQAGQPPSPPAEQAAPSPATEEAAPSTAAEAATAEPAVAAPAEAPTPAPAPARQAPAAPAPTPGPAPSVSRGDTEVALTQMRRAIARKMTQVKQTVPHAYTVVEVDMTNVVRWREGNNATFKAREGGSLSYVAAVVKAVTETLRVHPNLNSQFADDKIILKRAMNIGIAVAVDNGLIVPVIHDADQLSISGVNARIRDLAARAHSNKLRLDELQGGTFTVNNTGWFGSVSSMPIINAPEVAILSMEAIVKRPRVIEVDGEDVIAIRHMMNMTCSFDHRVLDGAQVGSFLADVRTSLEEWDANMPVG